MELIRWIRQQANQIRYCWIIARIQKSLMCREILKKSEIHKQIEKKQLYREPDFKKWKKFHRK